MEDLLVAVGAQAEDLDRAAAHDEEGPHRLALQEDRLAGLERDGRQQAATRSSRSGGSARNAGRSRSSETVSVETMARRGG